MDFHVAAAEAMKSLPPNAEPPTSSGDGSGGGTTAPPAPLESPPIPEFQKLDARVIRLWQVMQMILAVIVLVFLAAAAVVLSGVVGVLAVWFVLLGAWAGVAVLVVWLVWSYPRWAYDAWGYRIDTKVLETRSGVVFRVTRLLPLPRLQHVDLQRGPLERSFGLASLVLHTAGTHEATITIPGLDGDEAARLRDTLVKVGGDDAV